MPNQHKIAQDTPKPEQRRHGRATYMAYDKIRLITANNKELGQLVDISSTGVKFRVTGNDEIMTGDHWFDVEVRLNDKKIGCLPELRLRNRQLLKSGTFVGCSIHYPTREPMSHSANERVRERRKVSKSHIARIVGEHPVNFADATYFEIEDITDQGMLLSTSLRNRFILPGMQFNNTSMTLGHIDNLKCSFTITYCLLSKASNRLICGVKFGHCPAETLSALATFLMMPNQDSVVSNIEAIKLAGLSPKKVKPVVRYTYATTAQHLLDVSSLRWKAYGSAGKIDQAAIAPDQMIDEYDTRSTIVAGYIGEELVASVRLTECFEPEDRFEIESETTIGSKYKKDLTMEISRMCVLPELHGTDLVHGMMEHAAKVFLSSGKRYLITSCTDDLLSFYKKIGYRPTGQTYRLKALNNSLHYIIDITPDQVVSGRRINPIYWTFTYARIYDYLSSRGYVRSSLWAKFKLLTYRIFGGYALSLMKRRSNQKRKRTS